MTKILWTIHSREQVLLNDGLQWLIKNTKPPFYLEIDYIKELIYVYYYENP